MDRLLAATFEAERDHFWFRGFEGFVEPVLARATHGRTGLRMLDCGFGTGANMARLAKFGEVWGLDLVTGGVAHARARGQTRLTQASVTSIPFADASFDLVTAFDLLACLYPDGQRVALAEMHRVLKPGGALVLNTAALPVLRGSHAVFGGEVYRARREPLRRRLESAGFRTERLSYTNCSLLPLMLAVRLAQRALGIADPEHPPIDLQVPPSLVNGALTALLRLEASAMKRVNMPIGSSLLGLAFKPPLPS